jgi:hypothetical protein
MTPETVIEGCQGQKFDLQTARCHAEVIHPHAMETGLNADVNALGSQGTELPAEVTTTTCAK